MPLSNYQKTVVKLSKEELSVKPIESVKGLFFYHCSEGLYALELFLRRWVVKKALIISADSFEDSELLVPLYRLKEEGYEVDIASLKRGRIQGKHGYRVDVTLKIDDVDPDEYELLILPGGKAPEELRKSEKVLEVVKRFHSSKKPIAAICHGPQILVSAGLLKGIKATCYRTVAKELKSAEAIYTDSEVVVDGNIITSRQPGDLPAFLREIIRKVKGSK